MSELPPPRIITSRGDFHQALRECFAVVAERGSREIFISDVDFADWPLSDREVIDCLTRWAYAHRKLTVLARHFDEFPRRHARWVSWRRQFSHIVDCRSFDEADAERASGLFLAPEVVTLRVLDAEHYRASLSFDAADALVARDRLDALLQRSAEAFPASTLGL